MSSLTLLKWKPFFSSLDTHTIFAIVSSPDPAFSSKEMGLAHFARNLGLADLAVRSSHVIIDIFMIVGGLESI